MGQRQSTIDADGDIAKASFYELLGVEKSASEDEIKKAYRKKALELHPDRNYGNVEEATRLFSEIQTAYEVLSDPQERAWYDSHEDAVLSNQYGASDGISATTSEDVARLIASFSGKSDFSDSPGGFFTTIREALQDLAREEQLSSQDDGSNPVDYPSFGTSEDDFLDVVKPFYDVWSAFSTRKSFAWKDLYRLNEAPDRRVRRAMEKENKRLRDDAVRDFNETVRTLVSFIKKRDPRWKANQVSEAERQQQLRDQTAAQAAKARAANRAKMDTQPVPQWVNTQELRDEQAENEQMWEDSGDEPVQHFECVVCNKVFKTEKQYEAHERSKKHVQAVKRIQREMRREGLDLGLDDHRQPIETEGTAENVNHDDENDNVKTIIDENASESFRVDGKQAEPPLDADGQEDLTANASSDTLSEEDDDYAPRDVVLDRMAQAIAKPSAANDSNDDDGTAEMTVGSKAGRAKQKRAKKAARQSAGSRIQGLLCKACKTDFSSKNQLFMHLKQNPSHAQPVDRHSASSK